MKIKIEYDYWAEYHRAFAMVDNEPFVGLSDVSWADAKEKLLKNLQKAKKEPVPESEEIEL